MGVPLPSHLPYRATAAPPALPEHYTYPPAAGIRYRGDVIVAWELPGACTARPFLRQPCMRVPFRQVPTPPVLPWMLFCVRTLDGGGD